MGIAHDFRQVGSIGLSLSAFLTVHNTDYRNGVGVENPHPIELIGRRVYGELGYAALVVVSLVETVVRGILFYACIPILIPALCCGSEREADDILGFAIEVLGAGSLISLANTISCTNAFVRNIFEGTLHYGSLFPLLTLGYARAKGRPAVYIEAPRAEGQPAPA